MSLDRALFLDRDGTIIEDCGYPRDPGQVRLLPGAAEALKALASEGWKLIVISNQSGVGRGIVTAVEMEAVQERFLDLMREHMVPIAASYVCPHAPGDRCECRKPSPFLLQLAAREHSLDLAASWMIGDREADVLCGRNAGCQTIWLRNEAFPVPKDLPGFVADDWSAIFRRLSCSARPARANDSKQFR